MSANILQAYIDGVHYWHSPYNPESVQAHSGLHGSLLTKKASALLAKDESLNLRVTTFIHDRLTSATSLSPPTWTHAL